LSLPQQRKKVLVLLTAISMALAVLLTGCDSGSSGEGQKAEKPKVIRIGMVNWADCIAMTNVLKVVLEERLGYTVETTFADIAVIFSSIAQQDYDLYADAWLPLTHKDYMDKFAGSLEIISPTLTGARSGLVVPEYVTIDSITQLNDHKERFKSNIIGIDTGAGIMKATNQAIRDYGLDFELMASSGPVMTATLKGAIEKNEWVVVTGWNPHWKFARWDLKFLDDPKKVYGDEEKGMAVGHTRFRERFPDVTALLEKFSFTGNQLGAVMGLINDSDKEPYEVARQWVHDNPELVNKWVD
jgi:glycine betaine/proline transport system substrate-binding protein